MSEAIESSSSTSRKENIPNMLISVLTQGVDAALKASTKPIESESTWPSVCAANPEDPQADVRALIDLLRQEAEESTPENGAKLYTEIARLHETILGDQGSALKAVRHALKLDGSFAPAQRMAVRLVLQAKTVEHTPKLLQATAQSAASHRDRAHLLLEKGRFEEHRLGSYDHAAHTYEDVLQLDPTNIEAAEALLRLYLRGQHWSELANLCVRLADHEQDAATRGSLHIAAALLREQRLLSRPKAFESSLESHDSVSTDTRESMGSDTRESMAEHVVFLPSDRAEIVERALDDSQSPYLALPLAVSLFREAGDRESAIRVLERGTQWLKGSSASLVAPIHFQLSWYLAEQSGRLADAIAQAEQADRLDPRNIVYITWLAELYRRDARWNDLVVLLTKKSECDISKEEQIENYCSIAEIYETRLNTLPSAITALEAALKISPDDLPSLQALGRIYTKSAAWEPLIQMHLGEASASTDPIRRAAALYRCARVLEQRLRRRDAAIAHLEQAVRLDPQSLQAVRFLDELYRKDGRFRELVGLYRSELQRAEGEGHKVVLLEQIAWILDAQLNVPEEAIESYRALLDLRPDHVQALQALPRLYEATGNFPALLSALRAQVAHVNDVHARAAALMRMGQIYEEELKELDMALAHYEEALENLPTSHAFEQVGRLLFSAGRWADLVDLYLRQLEIATQPEERIRLHLRIARVHEQLDDLAGAIDAYREALQIDRTYWPALRGIVRASQKTDEVPPQELERHVIETLSTKTHESAATLWIGMTLGDQPSMEARTVMLEAIRNLPYRELATHLLLQLSIDHKDWKNAIASSTPLDATLIAAFAEHRLDDAYQHATKPLGNSTHADTSPLALLRLAELLAVARGDRTQHTDLLEQRLRTETDSAHRIAISLRLASMAEHWQLESKTPTHYCQSVLEIDPHEDQALAILEREAYRTQNHDLLLSLLESAAESHPDAAQRADFYAVRANVLMKKGMEEQACDNWKKALELDPSSRSAYEGLKRIYNERHRDEDLLWVLERGLGNVRHPGLRARDLLRRSDLFFEQGKADRAIVDLEEVLRLEPAHANALARLERIMRERGDLAKLVRIFQRAADDTSAPHDKANLYVKAGLILLNELRDANEASDMLARAIYANPDNTTALLAAADIHVQLDQPTEATALLNRVVLRCDDDQQLVTAHLALAYISHHLLDDSIRAKRSLEEILARTSDHLEAFYLLAEVSDQLGDLEELESALTKIISLEHDESRRGEIYAKLAHTLRKRHGGFTPEVVDALEEALSRTPHDAELVQDLVDFFLSTQQWEKLDRLLATHIPRLTDEQRPHFMLIRGRVLAQQLNRRDEAMTILRETIQRDPEQGEAIEILLQNLDEQALANPQIREEAISLHRRLLAANPLLVSSIRSLRELCHNAARDDEAFNAESALVFLNEASEEEEYFYKQRRRKLPQSSMGTLQWEYLVKIALPHGDHPVREILTILKPHLHELMPPDLTAYGLEDLNSAVKKKNSSSVSVFVKTAKMLNIDEYQIVQALGGAARGAAESGPPASAIVPPDFSRLPVPEQRFLSGRLLARIALNIECLDPGRAETFGVRDLEILLAAIQRTGDETFGANVAPAAILDDLVQRLRHLLTVSDLEIARQSAMEAWWKEPYRSELGNWIQSCEAGACCIGLLCCGSLDTIAAFMDRTGPSLAPYVQRELVRFSVSKEYADLRRELGIALP